MKWYKRLFWKSFLVIWLTSFMVLVATVLVIGAVSEKERLRELMEIRARSQAELIIERYEHSGFRPLPARGRWSELRPEEEADEHRAYHDRHPRHREGRPRLLLRIFDQQAAIQLYGPRQAPPSALALSSFELQSAQGRPYRVEVGVDWKRSRVGQFIRSLLSVQVILILLVSGVASLLITWIIVKPLNRLRAFTQALSAGELSVRADQPLCARGDEIGELAREFNRMADFVEQTLGAHQKLMQDVSHELRAPLARLQAAAGLAEQRWGQEERVIGRITRECQRLDQLIGEILSLSRLENMARNGEPFDLNELLGELVEDVRFSQPSRPLLWQPQAPCRIARNRLLLERALSNILGNACKHTPDSAAIELGVETLSQACVIRIRDRGPGVDPALLPRLCDPFVRSGGGGDGYGLGLSIAQRAVQRLGGRLVLRNHPQGGFEVALHLPRTA